MWTEADRAAFEKHGLVRLSGVFDADQAAAMEERVWQVLGQRFGVDREEPDTWDVPYATGLQGIRTDCVFAPNGGPALHAALDGLIGAGRWQVPRHWGQFLITFPSAPVDAARRSLWHTDFPYSLPADRLVGALVFSFLGEVVPNTGATLVLEGSHRVVERFMAARPKLRSQKMKVARNALMASAPFLASLRSEPGEDWAARQIGSEGEAWDEPLRVVELVGAPGDVVVCHPWMLHAASPNRSDRPRFMRVQRIGPARGERRA